MKTDLRLLCLLSLASWAASAAPSLREDFGSDPRSRTVTAKGKAMDVARTADAFWILVQGEEGDRLIELAAQERKVRKRHKLKGGGAAGVVATPEGLWVLARNGKRSLRLLDTKGAVQRTVKASFPAGKLYGLAWDGERFYTSAYAEKRSTIYSFDATAKRFERCFEVKGKVYALTWSAGNLLAYRRGGSVYSKHWLYVAPGAKDPKRMRFLEAETWGLCSYQDRPYLLERRPKGRARLSRFALRDKEGLVLGFAQRDRVEYGWTYSNANENAYDLDVWLPVPATRRFQEVEGVEFSPAPKARVRDAYGNEWAHFRFEGQSKGSTAKVEFVLMRVAAAQTLDAPARHSLDEAARALYTKPTKCFDYTHPSLSKGKRPKLKKGSLRSLLALRNYVNDRLKVDGKSGPERTASDFLSKGVGRCYAHTLSFAAFARKDGLPSRAVGGVKLPTKRGQRVVVDGDQVHTWNQVYLPAHGWAEIDAEADDDPQGKHSLGRFGYHANKWFLTFEGNFDALDHKQVFTERTWIGTASWRSKDKKNKAQLTRERFVRTQRP